MEWQEIIKKRRPIIVDRGLIKRDGHAIINNLQGNYNNPQSNFNDR